MIDQVLEFFRAGGWVMYPLMGLSILGLGAVLERLVFWIRNSNSKELRGLQRYSDLLEAHQRDQALAIASKDGSPMGELVESGTTGDIPSEEAIIAKIEMIRPKLESRIVLLSVVVAAAPLLGILGTVVGIIESFDLLGSASEVSDPTIVAGGIAEALYTTATGLTIALVVLFPSVYFKARANQSIGRLEVIGALLVKRES